MRIIKSTDNLHLGEDIPVLNTGDTLELAGFVFEVQKVLQLENGNTLYSSPNYQLECED